MHKCKKSLKPKHLQNIIRSGCRSLDRKTHWRQQVEQSSAPFMYNKDPSTDPSAWLQFTLITACNSSVHNFNKYHALGLLSLRLFTIYHHHTLPNIWHYKLLTLYMMQEKTACRIAYWRKLKQSSRFTISLPIVAYCTHPAHHRKFYYFEAVDTLIFDASWTNAVSHLLLTWNGRKQKSEQLYRHFPMQYGLGMPIHL